LRLLIMTWMRSSLLRHIWLEPIDGDVWTVPAETMKGRKDAMERGAVKPRLP